MAQFVGTVIGTKMDKTAKVLVTRMVLYRKLRKVRILSRSQEERALFKITNDRGKQHFRKCFPLGSCVLMFIVAV